MIQIDNRKGSKELAPFISEPTELKRLHFADFAFQGNGPHGPVSVGIERKSIRDLISSIISGRLSGHQLIGLINSYDYVTIVVDGAFKTGKDGYIRVPIGRGKWVVLQNGNQAVSRSFIDNYLYSLFLSNNVYNQFNSSARQTGLWVEAQYKWWQKPWAKHSAHLSFYTAPPKKAIFKKPSVTHRMIKEVDKVGWEVGLKIARAFPTMASIVMAEQKDLEKIPGVGKVLAARILDSLWKGK